MIDKETNDQINKLPPLLQQSARKALSEDKVVILSYSEWASVIGALQGGVRLMEEAANEPTEQSNYLTNVGMRITSQLGLKWND